MKDSRAEKVADILVDYSTEVKEGDLVMISGSYIAEPLILALYERCLMRGAHPTIRASIPAAEPLLYRHAKDPQLEYIWPTDTWIYDHIDVSFSIISDTNTRQLSKTDPARQVLRSKAREPLLERFFDRASKGEVRWNVTLFPTEAHAMDAEMSLAEYEDFYYGACLIDVADPVAAWKKTADRHAQLVDWFKGRHEVHMTGEGTDLTLEITDRIFLPADGKENFPDGEIFTGPVEIATRGHVTFSFPANYGGQTVEGIRLEFADGKVVDATATKNEPFLIKTLDTDDGSRILGELGIGTNYGITDYTGEVLLDEKIGGTVHLALGASYPESGGTNKSAVHWDMVCDLRRGGRVTVDGDTLLEDGKLLL